MNIGEAINVEYDGYLITTDKSLMHLAQIHSWLSEKSYWAEHRPFDIVKASFDNSFCIGILLNKKQIAFARLVTDYAVFGYLADVYVVEEHRRKGLSKKMMELLFSLDWVKNLNRTTLATKDAHTLYEKVGFTPLRMPERMMELVKTNILKLQ